MTLGEEYPRLQVMRGPKRKGVRYFGPYSHAWAIRETLDLLLRVFPARTCAPGCSRAPARSAARACSATSASARRPASAGSTAEEHRAIVEDFCAFMAGDTARYVRRLEREMRAASDAQEYERAARLRDDIGALDRALERNAVVLGDGTDADVVALAEDPLEAAVQVFHVRGGRVRGQRGWVVDRVEDLGTGRAGRALPPPDVRRRVRRRGAARGARARAARPTPRRWRDWLTERRGVRVDLRVPQRGDKRALLETVARNAQQTLALHKTRRGQRPDHPVPAR